MSHIVYSTSRAMAWLGACVLVFLAVLSVVSIGGRALSGLGLGPVPGIAGRSPSYVVRQFWDFQHGARAGAGSVLMRPTVERLTLDDMIALAAYVASLAP
mgnify:CR=1 FL=1